MKRSYPTVFSGSKIWSVFPHIIKTTIFSNLLAKVLH